MSDASDFAVGVVLGQRVDKKLNVIYYASKILDSAQKNYATTEKEFLVVVCNNPDFTKIKKNCFWCELFDCLICLRCLHP